MSADDLRERAARAAAIAESMGMEPLRQAVHLGESDEEFLARLLKSAETFIEAVRILNCVYDRVLAWLKLGVTPNASARGAVIEALREAVDTFCRPSDFEMEQLKAERDARLLAAGYGIVTSIEGGIAQVVPHREPMFRILPEKEAAPSPE